MRIQFNMPSSNQPRKSSAFDELHNKAFPEVAKRRPNFIKKYHSLNNLFDKPLSQDRVKKILMIWAMTIYASGMTANVNTRNDEDTYLNGISTSIEGLKKDLIGWEKHGTTFQINSLILGKEPNTNRFLLILDQLYDFVAICRANKKFGNGSDFHPDYIKKYGIFSLFHLGAALGLTHAKRNSALFKFIEIVTELEKSQIYKYFKQYNETEFKLIPNNNNLLSLIYTAYRAILDPAANPRYPARFVANYSNGLVYNLTKWC